ncbi:MAG: hypothetical protein SF182_22450 [Deltaproteobacteria bacterium]|nr:hypothetical protein [Deltaproteobacteria bacterium]
MPAAAPPTPIAGVAALLALARAALPTGLAVLLAFAAADLWQMLDPISVLPASGRLEAAIVGAQLDRARTIPADTDVVTIGDSAGLINIDPGALRAGLDGASVEGLNTVGFAGPHGHARMLNDFLARGGRPQRLLVAMRNLSPPSGASARQVERLFVSPRALPPPRLLPRIRARLQGGAETLLYLPLPGAWGDYYGGVEQYDAFLRERHGFVHDPVPARATPFPVVPPFGLNDTFRAELPELAAAIAALGADRVRLVLMPENDAWDAETTAAGHAAALRELHTALGLDAARQLDGLPIRLGPESFASFGHLNAAGRAQLTAALAAALRRDRARYPWPIADLQG